MMMTLQKLKIKSVTAKPFFDNDLFSEQLNEVHKQWKELLLNTEFQAAQWFLSDGRRYVLSPSINKEKSFRLTCFIKHDIPLSHMDYPLDSVGAGDYYDILHDLPYSTEKENVLIEVMTNEPLKSLDSTLKKFQSKSKNLSTKEKGKAYEFGHER